MIFSDDFEGADLSAYTLWVNGSSNVSETSRTVLSTDWACSPTHSVKCSVGNPNPDNPGMRFKSLITATPPDGTSYYTGFVLRIPAGFWNILWSGTFGGIGNAGPAFPLMWFTASNSVDWGASGSNLFLNGLFVADSASTGHLLSNGSTLKSFADDSGSTTSCESRLSLTDTVLGDPSVSEAHSEVWIDGINFTEPGSGEYTTYTDHYAEIGVAIGTPDSGWDSTYDDLHWYIDKLKFDSARIGVQTCGSGKLHYYHKGAWHQLQDA